MSSPNLPILPNFPQAPADRAAKIVGKSVSGAYAL
jgi:hypothetical protein